MNSAAALMAGDRAHDLRTAAGMAAESIDSGAALKKLEEIKKVSNNL